MEFNFNKKDKQKSFIIAIILFAFLITILFFIRFWPPSNIAELAGSTSGEGGVTINFGNTDMGMGDNTDNQTLAVNQIQPAIQPTATQDENIISEENSADEGIVIPKKELPKKTKVVVQNNEKPIVVSKPKTITNTALNNFIKGAKTSDGNTKTSGNQGLSNGSLSKNGYEIGGNGDGKGKGRGVGTSEGDGKGNGKGLASGYSLGNRKAISKPKPDSSCSNDTGNVVVEVTVDKYGNTISAVVGKRGTTITAKCLKDQARQAALTTKWASSPDGDEQQVGEIIYSFGLN